MKVLFIFLDGVGLGQDDPATNPFAQASLPNIQALLAGHKLLLDGAGPTKSALIAHTPEATLFAVDACMGVEGIPQSATGQASLLTGKNVSAWLGEHEGPKPTPPIMELIHQGTIFTTLLQRAKVPAFINAYPPRYFAGLDSGYRLPGVIALSAKQAGLRLRTKDDLYAGEAISADFSGEGWRDYLGFPDAPVLSLAQVAARMAALADAAHLTLFEYWLTDVAGHHQDAQAARSILQTLDAVIGSLATSMDMEQHLVLVTSDHGNLEDLSTRHHTRNPVPLLLIGSKSIRETFLEKMNLHRTCRSDLDLTVIPLAILDLLD